MAYRILVVKAEQEFVATLKSLIIGYKNDFDISFVAGRKEAMTELNAGVFDRIVTPLNIPRISDGYLFLTHIVKTLTSKKVIVLVDGKSNEVERSINTLGIKHLFSASNVKGVFQALLEDAGLKTVQNAGESEPFDVGRLTVDMIKTSLNLVMGPVGNMIFIEAATKVANPNDIKSLINTIVNEIGDKKKIALFRTHLE